jgi:hypothetical protein
MLDPPRSGVPRMKERMRRSWISGSRPRAIWSRRTDAIQTGRPGQAGSDPNDPARPPVARRTPLSHGSAAGLATCDVPTRLSARDAGRPRLSVSGPIRRGRFTATTASSHAVHAAPRRRRLPNSSRFATPRPESPRRYIRDRGVARLSSQKGPRPVALPVVVTERARQ